MDVIPSNEIKRIKNSPISKKSLVDERAMQPPGEKSSLNVCATIKCPFFELKSNSDKCLRYSQACQCHLSTVADVQSDGYWLFTANESELQQLKKVNDRFLAKDKATQKQLKLLTARASQTKGGNLENRVSSTLEIEIPRSQPAEA